MDTIFDERILFLGMYSKEIIKQKYVGVPLITLGLFIIAINQTTKVLFNSGTFK